MRYLPRITIVLWTFVLLGPALVPMLATAPLHFPLIILLSILLPVCFWHHSRHGRKWQALLFIVLFAGTVANTARAVYAIERARADLAAQPEKGLSPALLKQATSGATETERRVSARMIYWLTGVSVYYRSEEQAAVLFSPVDSDLRRHNRYLISVADRDYFAVGLAARKSDFLLHLALELGLFLLLLIYLSFRAPSGPESGAAGCRPIAATADLQSSDPN